MSSEYGLIDMSILFVWVEIWRVKAWGLVATGCSMEEHRRLLAWVPTRASDTNWLPVSWSGQRPAELFCSVTATKVPMVADVGRRWNGRKDDAISPAARLGYKFSALAPFRIPITLIRMWILVESMRNGYWDIWKIMQCDSRICMQLVVCRINYCLSACRFCHSLQCMWMSVFWGCRFVKMNVILVRIEGWLFFMRYRYFFNERVDTRSLCLNLHFRVKLSVCCAYHPLPT